MRWTMTESWKDLDRVLDAIYHKRQIQVTLLKPSLRQIVVTHAERTGQEKGLEKAFNYVLIAEALLQNVWRPFVRLERGPGESDDDWAERCLAAFIPVAQYLKPAVEEPKFPLRIEVVRRLADRAWLAPLIEGKLRQGREVEGRPQARGQDGQASQSHEFRQLTQLMTHKAQSLIGPNGKLIGSSYNRRREYGVQYLFYALLTAVERLGVSNVSDSSESSVSMPEQHQASDAASGAIRLSQAGAVPPLPPAYVPRHQVLQSLKAQVFQTQPTNDWIAVTGVEGIGKTVLLNALGQDKNVLACFDGRVCWFEITAGLDQMALINQVARGLNIPLPGSIETLDQVRAVVHRCPHPVPALVLVDNISRIEQVMALRELGPSVTVVFSTCSSKVIAALEVAAHRWFTLGGMEETEALTLVQRLSHVPAGQEETIRRVLQLVDYHPFAIKVAAGYSQQASPGDWAAVEAMLRDSQARLRVWQAWGGELAQVQPALEAIWDSFSPELQKCWAALGRRYFLHWFDVRLGRAVWRVSAAEAQVIWNELVGYHLAEPLPGQPGCYRLHWLAWDFARQKIEAGGWWQKWRPAMWEGRYFRQTPRKRFPLVIPAPADAPHWRWWLPRVPIKGEAWSWSHFYGWLNLVREHRQAHLNILAGPEEWATVTLWNVILLGDLILGFGIGMGMPALLPQLVQRFAAAYLVVMAVMTWIASLAHRNLVQAVRWRWAGKSFIAPIKGE